MQHVQQTHRVRFRCVGTNVHRDLAVLHVVVGIGHGAVAPCVGHTGYRGGVANASLVIAIVRAKETHPFAQKISLLIVVLGGAHKIQTVWAAGFFQLHHLGTDLVQCGIPTDPLVLAVDQLHGIAQTKLSVAMFTNCRTFSAMRAQVDR